MEVKKITEQYNQIIIDWIEVGFNPTSYVKWAIDFPIEQKSIFPNSSIIFYPEIIQFPDSNEDKYSIFFGFRILFKKEEQKEVLDFLVEAFSLLKYKPVRATINNSFNINYCRYFTEPEQVQIRENHILHGCYQCKFYISPDYPELILE